MTHNNIRLNRATREWVICAPNRKGRPQEFLNRKPLAIVEEKPKEQCPFCDPSQQSTEKILLEIPSLAAGRGWQVRVVPNKYPVLSADVALKRSLSGVYYLELPGYGHHEIVIETPDHDTTLALMSVPEVAAVVEAYYQRYLDLMRVRENLWVIIFRNHGKSAGASMQHPHSQIIATPIVPRHRRWHEDEAQRYFDEWGRCAYCDMLEFENDEQLRVVGSNDHFLAFIPFAAEVPFEVWILPKHHQSEFGAMTQEQRLAFADILHNILSKIYHKLNNPDYNYAIITAARYKIEEPQLHWYCQIRPRLTTAAGFELGSGISINPSLPEVDALFLNDN
ncbi:galactose-1-phosphate uridylyltransferase [Trichothermofontia sp.]